MKKILTALLVTTVLSCGADDSKETIAGPQFGASDSLFSVQDRGFIAFGDEVGGEFNESATYYGYKFVAESGGVFDVEITQRGTSRGLDTTMFLFAKSENTDGWVELAFDDDDGWGPLSKIVNWEARGFDEYQVVIGTADGRGRGRFNLELSCKNDACIGAQPQPADVCAFGETYYELVNSSPTISILDQNVVGPDDDMTELEREQIFIAIVQDEEGIDTLEQAFEEWTDEGSVYKTRFFDASNRLEFVAYEFGSGDNSYGAVFEATTTTQVAFIGDGDLYDCTVQLGPERIACSDASDCASGLQCNGVVNGVGACLDPSLRTPGDGDSCEVTADCGTGLVCAGENAGDGYCNPAWMRRKFYDDEWLSAPVGVTERSIDVVGLASVSTDVNVELFLYSDDYSTLRVTLTNPSGTEAVLHDRDGEADIIYRDKPVFGFPGDEDANGTWTLRVENTGTEAASMYEFGLEVTSRWD